MLRTGIIVRLRIVDETVMPGADEGEFELLVAVGTAAYQTIARVRLASIDEPGSDGRPKKIDSCFAYASDSPLVLRAAMAKALPRVSRCRRGTQGLARREGVTSSEASLAQRIWRTLAGEDRALDALHFSGPAGSLPSPFHVSDLACATIGVATLAAAELWASRRGEPLRPVRIDRPT